MEVSRKRTQRRASVLVPHLADEVLDCPPLELRRDDLDIPDVRVLREERFQRVLDVRVLFESGEGRVPALTVLAILGFAVLQYISGYRRIQHIPFAPLMGS